MQRRHNRAASSVDMTLHGTRRQCDGSSARAHRRRKCGVEVVMSGRLNSGNYTNVATRAQSRGELGEDDPICGSQVAATVA
jgi:hypothetical protein